MRPYQGLLLLLFGLILLSAPKQAMADNDLKRDIIDRIITLYDIDTSRAVIEIIKNRLDPDIVAYDSLTVTPLTRGEPRGGHSVAVSLFQADKPIEKGQVRINIDYYDTVLVTTAKIRRNDSLPHGTYARRNMKVTSLTATPLTSPEQLRGRRVKRTIGRNQILTSDMIEEIPEISFGQPVTIRYRDEAFEITALGTALDEGSAGDLIKVKNDQSRQIIACTVIDSETVQASGTLR